jgi:hypothetical protein
MTPEFERKFLREYLEIIQNPEKRYVRYNRMKISLWLVTLLLGVMLYFSGDWNWLDPDFRLILALLAGVLFCFAYTIGYSLAQQPLIVKYMDGPAIEERLRELDA